MKIEILKQNLKKALSCVERITRKVTTLPVLQNVLITAKDNFLELSTTNLEVSIKWWVLAKIEKPGVVLIPATFLSNLINLIESEKIEFHEENKNLILTSQNQEIQVQGQSPDEFPIIPKVEKESSWNLSISSLEQGLSQIVEVPSQSQIRPEISGVYFNLKKGKLKLVATDSFRLAEKTLDIKTEKEAQFIVPQATSRELLNLLTQEEGEVSFYIDANQVLFEFQDKQTQHPKIQLSGRLIEGEYPNYTEIIPKKSTTKVQIKKESLLTQVKKAGLFTGKVGEIKITAIPDENKLKVFSQSTETGRNESYLECNVEGKESEVSFNYKFLVDGLNSIKSTEVTLELSGSEGPGLLRPVGDDSFLYILMPIKPS